MRRYRVIVNPVAGHGTGWRSIARIRQLLTSHELDYDLVKTERRGHAMELTIEAARDAYDVVVAAGGDGTSNEVINGIMELKMRGENPPAMGVLGVGRGNDFAHAVGVPCDLGEAVDVLVEGRRRPIDVGRVTGGDYPDGRFFGNCVGVGFDAIGTIEVAKLPRLGGFLSFFIAVLKTILLHFEAPLTRVQYDEIELRQPMLMVSIMNGRRLGGGFWMAPNSEPDDGLFDLCIAGKLNRIGTLRMIPHFLKGTQASQEVISTGQAARITIEALEGSLPAHTDGEILCVEGTKLEIEMLPRQIEVVTRLPREI